MRSTTGETIFISVVASGMTAAFFGVALIQQRDQTDAYKTKANYLQSSINNYAADGNGSIHCQFQNAGTVTFANQKVSQINEQFRPLVIEGFKTGACFAELPQIPKAAKNQPANSLQLQTKKNG
jgi:hypothetical protein